MLGNNENRKIKDKSFPEKKPVYLASRLSLNDYFQDTDLTQWSEKEIQACAAELAKIAARIWMCPPSAKSRDLFGNNETRLKRRSIVSRNPLNQLVGSEQAIYLNDVALAVDPFRFNGIEP